MHVVLLLFGLLLSLAASVAGFFGAAAIVGVVKQAPLTFWLVAAASAWLGTALIYAARERRAPVKAAGAFDATPSGFLALALYGGAVLFLLYAGLCTAGSLIGMEAAAGLPHGDPLETLLFGLGFTALAAAVGFAFINTARILMYWRPRTDAASRSIAPSEADKNLQTNLGGATPFERVVIVVLIVLIVLFGGGTVLQLRQDGVRDLTYLIDWAIGFGSMLICAVALVIVLVGIWRREPR